MKKRIVAGVMAGMLFGASLFSAYADPAESIDLTAMTYDQLLKLSTDVKLEMIKRGEFKEQKYRGIYTVGLDLPAGRYKFLFDKESGKKRVSIVVYSDKETYQEYYTTNSMSHNFLSETLTEEDNSIEVTLEDGNILIVSDGSAKGFISSAY